MFTPVLLLGAFPEDLLSPLDVEFKEKLSRYAADGGTGGYG
jgi:hypothetical protein